MTAPLTEGRAVASAGEATERTSRWKAPPFVRGLRAAFAFFTRIPVGGFPYQARDLAWAAGYAPLVGLVLGSALGGLAYLLLPLGGFPGAVLVIAASMLLTGALHEDGLADTSDALGGAHDPARVLAILKDSRVGSFGAAALTVSIVGRAALIGRLGDSCYWAMPLVGCAARVGPVWLMASLPYVTPAHQSKSEYVAKAALPQAFLAGAWLVIAVLACGSAGWITPPRAAVLALVLATVTCLTGWRYKRRVGGITGDFLGATEQLGELGALAVLTWSV